MIAADPLSFLGSAAPGRSSAVAIDCHNAHAIVDKMADDFQSNTRGTTCYHRCAFCLNHVIPLWDP
jgi:hypothetical protein